MRFVNRVIFISVFVAMLSFFVAVPQNVYAGKYASLVIDADTGIILHQKYAGKRRYPASLTKMMTLYLTFQALDRRVLRMSQRLHVSRAAANQRPSKLGLRAGQTISVKNAVYALIVKSANDASVVLAEAISGSERRFARKMTRVGRQLGMRHTNFSNASGLPNRRQVTTAYDMARLAVALRRDFPKYYHLFSKTKFRYKGRTYYSHNNVTRLYKGADGLKTGYIRASGFNLVTSAKRRGSSIIGVVMGGKSTKSRDRHMVKLLDRAFYKMARGRGYNKNNRVAGIYRKKKMRSYPTPNLKLASKHLDNTIPLPIFKDSGGVASNVMASHKMRDLFAHDKNSSLFLRTKAVSYIKKSLVGNIGSLKPIRVRVHGKKVPLPTLKSTLYEEDISNVANGVRGKVRLALN